ncbi:MAG: PQQ-binding-like beta-propeller repeat protein, partial [Candidatus Micrarchaeota archaeon]|nr:PQQ-binding-like beta-propeller repeat protein [Candidatus Micrarchaeota archaeon]
SLDSSSEGISSTVLLEGGMVYVAYGPLGPESVAALYQSNGTTAWVTALNTTMTSVWASPILYNGLIYIGTAANQAVLNNESNASRQGEIYALNASTGALVWNTILAGNSGGASIWGSVVVDPVLNSVYLGTGNSFGNDSNSLYAYSVVSLNAANGNINWYNQVYNGITYGKDLDFGSTPNLFSFVLNGTTYNAIGIGNKDANYYIFDRYSSKYIEKFPNGGAADGGIIGLAGFIYRNGSVNDTELFIPSNYNATNSSGNGGEVEAIYPSNGFSPWHVVTPGAIEGSVSIIPGAVIFGDNRGNMYAVSINDGKVIFNTTLNRGIEAGITPAEGHILVPTAFGNSGEPGLYAFAASAEKNNNANTAGEMLINYTYSITPSTPGYIYIAGANTLIRINSATPTNATLVAINVTNTIQLPGLLIPVVVLNLSITAPANITSRFTMSYPCYLQQDTIEPYILENAEWQRINSFSIDPEACRISFSLSNHQTIGIFVNQQAAARAQNSTNSTAPKVVQQSQNISKQSGGKLTADDVELIIIFIISLAIIAYFIRKE